MPDHVRKQIRDALVLKLTGLDTTGTNVYQNRVDSFKEDDLPALAVFSLAEGSEVSGVSQPRIVKRALNLSVEAYVKENETSQDSLDQICSEVETVFQNDITLGGLAKDMVLTNTIFELSGEEEKDVVVAKMTWQIKIQNLEQQPGVIK